MYFKKENTLELITSINIIEGKHSHDYSVKITNTDRIINLTLQESKFVFNNLCQRLVGKEIIDSKTINGLIEDINERRIKNFPCYSTTFNKEINDDKCYTTSTMPKGFFEINVNENYINSTYIALKTKSEEDDN